MALLALFGILATRGMAIYPNRFQNVMEAARQAGLTHITFATQTTGS